MQRVDDGVDESLAHAHAGCVAAARARYARASLARRCARSCARPSTPAWPQARAAAPAMEVDIVESRTGDARLRGAPLLHRTIRHILRVTRAWWIGHTSLRRSVHGVPDGVSERTRCTRRPSSLDSLNESPRELPPCAAAATVAWHARAASESVCVRVVANNGSCAVPSSSTRNLYCAYIISLPWSVEFVGCARLF